MALYEALQLETLLNQTANIPELTFSMGLFQQAPILEFQKWH